MVGQVPRLHGKRGIAGSVVSLTESQLDAIMPYCAKDKLTSYTRYLNVAMFEAKITSVTRAAAFLGQLAHESGELRFMEEMADGSYYEGRKDLGNTHPGDGRRYKGRGPIQLTGRANYRAAGAALGIDLEEHPEKAAQPEVGFRVAGWYWAKMGCNAFADALDHQALRRAVNGGTDGFDNCLRYYRLALEVLGRDTLLLKGDAYGGLV